MFDGLARHRSLFQGVLAWFLLASVLGVLIGCGVSLFVGVLETAIEQVVRLPYDGVYLLPLGLLMASLIMRYWTKKLPGHGTDQVIYAMHHNEARVDYGSVPAKLLATVVTIACRGSLGKEGPCVQIGSGIAGACAKWLRISDVDRSKLVACGIGAGFSAVFGTPLAGTFFAAEILTVGRVDYAVLLPSFVGGIMACQTAIFFGNTYFQTQVTLPGHFSELFIFEVLLAGAGSGLCALLFINVIGWMRQLASRLSLPTPVNQLVGGGLVMASVLVSPHYLGLGFDYMEPLLRGEVVAHWYDGLMKMYTTSATMSFGGVGGDITPIFFVGSSFGSFLAQAMGMNAGLVAALCAVGVLSGCTKTPVASTILAMELFGADVGPYAALVCLVSFLLSGEKGVYASQENGFNALHSLALRREPLKEAEPQSAELVH